MKPLKAIKSLISSLLATVSPQRFADCGVRVDVESENEALKVKTEVLELKIANLEHYRDFLKGGIDISISQVASLKLKLDAAADALRRIECLTDKDIHLDIIDQKVIHITAQIGWRATQA